MDPLQSVFDKFPFDLNKISDVAVGSNYVAVMLVNGNIGLAARLQMDLNKDCLAQSPSPKSLHCRPFLLAYYNALLNYDQKYGACSDVIEVGNFDKDQRIVMVGYFRPLFQKLSERGVVSIVFDLQDDSPEVTSIDLQRGAIRDADKIILTATSLINNTFSSIVNNSNDKAQIFIVGPSACLYPNFYHSHKIKGVFGSCFPAFSKQLMALIAEGGGMRDFSSLASKVRV